MQLRYETMQFSTISPMKIKIPIKKEQSMLTPGEVLAQIRSGGLSTPAESVTFIREDRNARSRR